MPRFSADPARLFPDLPLLDGLETAAAAGFEGVDLPQPYDNPAPETRRALMRHGLGLASIACPPPNYTGGTPGFAAHEGGGQRFRHDLRRVLRYADVLRPDLVELRMANGAAPVSESELADNLRHATEAAPDLRFAVRPLGGALYSGSPLADAATLAELLSGLGGGRVGLVLEIGGTAHNVPDALRVWDALKGAVAHVTIASEPPDLTALFAALDTAGYRGWVSAAYIPSRRIATRPAWLPETA